MLCFLVPPYLHSISAIPVTHHSAANSQVCSEPQITALRPDVCSLSLQVNSNLAPFERDQESTVLIKNIHEFAPWKARNHITCQSGQDSVLREKKKKKCHFK